MLGGIDHERSDGEPDIGLGRLGAVSKGQVEFFRRLVDDDHRAGSHRRTPVRERRRAAG
jgi:hypothetical protein